MASVSRTPVREAIRMLDADGLVRPSNDGLIVSGLSAQELLDLCVVREALEGLATRPAASTRPEVDTLARARPSAQRRPTVAAGGRVGAEGPGTHSPGSRVARGNTGTPSSLRWSMPTTMSVAVAPMQ